MVIWEDPPASDNSGNVTVTCNPQSGIILTIGETPVTCEAVDGSGNKAVCSFPVYVRGNYCINASLLNISPMRFILLAFMCVMIGVFWVYGSGGLWGVARRRGTVYWVLEVLLPI